MLLQQNQYQNGLHLKNIKELFIRLYHNLLRQVPLLPSSTVSLLPDCVNWVWVISLDEQVRG